MSSKLTELKKQLDFVKFSRKLFYNSNYGIPPSLMTNNTMDDFETRIEKIRNEIKKEKLNIKIKKIIKNGTKK